MSCSSTFTFSENVSGNFFPLNTAVYVASTDKILGTMENYLCEFNATTGAFIRAVKASSPMYGPMYLGLISGAPYLACYNDRSVQETLPVPDANRLRIDIFPVNTTTLLLGAGLGIAGKSLDSRNKSMQGPHFFLNISNRCFFTFPLATRVQMGYIDITNPAVWNINFANHGLWTEQISTDGTFVYSCDPTSPEIFRRNTSLTYSGFVNTPSNFPMSCEYSAVDLKVYAVCGNNILIRADNWTTHTAAVIDLDALIPAQAGMKILRLRYRASDQQLYLPCQNKNGIFVYNTAGTAVFKSGFSSPIDVVFTPSKAFAVQTAAQGLKEIS